MMVCWVCNRFTADRGEICHVCKRLAGEDSRTPELRLELRKFAGVLVALLSVAMGLLSPAVVSRPSLPWRHPSKFAALLPATAPVSYQTSMVVQQVKRKVYPYSLVPGGAENVHEAKWAMADPAVKNNYAQFDVAQLKQVKLTTNISGYVSYRWGDKIYWTARRITLRAGETVFTDGVHIVRGRCLNCYSALPMLPIRPHEPSEIAFDTPAELPVTVYSFPKLPVLAPELPVPPGELTPSVPVLPAGAPPTAGKPPGGIWFPLLPIIPPIHRHHGPPPGPPTPGVPQVPPPVAVVPEPRYGFIAVAGFFAIILVLRRKRLRFSPERLSEGKDIALT